MVGELFGLSLQGVARGVFNYIFFMLAWLIYMLIKRLGKANIYNYDQSRPPFFTLIELAMHGTIAGFVLGLAILFLGLPIMLSEYLLLLIPISLILGMGNIRYLCMSYSAGVLGILAIIFNGQVVGSLTLPNINIEVNGLMAMVGALHLAEGVLIILYGDRDAIPIVSKKDDQIILGHIIQRYWPIPFVALLATTSAVAGGTINMPDWWPLVGERNILAQGLVFVPMSLVGLIGYSTVTFASSTKKRMRNSGLGIIAYGVILIVLATIHNGSLWMNIIGVLAMAGLHELVLLLELHFENTSEPIYPLPDKGIRIMFVNAGSIAEKMGLEIGDIVKTVNGIDIVNIKHFKAVMKQQLKDLSVIVEDVYKKERQLTYASPEEGITAIGIKMIPEKPPVLFKGSNMMKIGMLHLMRNKNIKK